MKTIQHLDMTAHLESYKARVLAEAKAAAAVRAAVAAGGERPVPTERLRVTDLH